MATTAVDPVFVDTNVLVYSRIPSAPLHLEAATALNSITQTGAALWVSRQILREFLATVTRPQFFMQPLPILQVAAELQILESAVTIADETAAVTKKLLDLLLQTPCGGKQVHDANIVATMLVNGIPNLLTHNAADFARFAALINVVPLVP